jgi:hypothetical protein
MKEGNENNSPEIRDPEIYTSSLEPTISSSGAGSNPVGVLSPLTNINTQSSASMTSTVPVSQGSSSTFLDFEWGFALRGAFTQAKNAYENFLKL